MNNYFGPGEVLTLTAPYDTDSGEGAQVGSIFGVAVADYLSGDTAAQYKTVGEYLLAKTSAQAWTAGQKIYWDNSLKVCDSDSTLGMLIGTATVAADNPSSTGYVRLNGAAPSTSEGPQAAIVALTDSTGLSGTHDDTLAATAALVTLTDSTGGSGSHDDTLADGLTVTAPAAITAVVLGDLVATQNTGWGAASEADFDDISTQFDALHADVTALSAKVGLCVTDLGVQNQNDSDLAQKMIEVVAQMAVTNQNISDVAQKVLEIRTALIAFGVIAA